MHTNGKPNPRFIIMERREKVHIMLSQGLSEKEIAAQLNVDQSTVCRDVKSIKKRSQDTLQGIEADVLPYEFSNCLVSMDEIIKQCWIIFQDESGKWTNKDKIYILKLLKEAIRTKLELLLHGPINLSLSHLSEEVKQLKQENENPRMNFFGLPSIRRLNDEDLT